MCKGEVGNKHGLLTWLCRKSYKSTYNLYVERQNQGDPLTYEELWRTLKKKGSRLPEDHYRNPLQIFRAIKNFFLQEIQTARQDWELLVQEAKSAAEGLPEGEMKKLLLGKLMPETKQKIRDSQADEKVLGNLVEVRGLPDMGKMAVRELLNSISAIGMRDITLREGRWRGEFHDSEQSDFSCNMVDGKVKFKGTVLKVRPWIFSYGVEQMWDQLEKYANLEPQKSHDVQGFGGKISAAGGEGCACAFPLEEKVGQQLTRPQTMEGAPQISKSFSPKWTERQILPKIPSRLEHEMLTNIEHGQGKGKGQSKGKSRDWTSKDYSQQGGDPNCSRWTEAGGKSVGKSGEKGGKGQ